jgi:cobalt-zinc-cadmium efflux system membrane fusion protein
MKTQHNQLISTLCALLFLFTACSQVSHQHEEENDHHTEKQEEVHLVQKQMDVMDIQLGQFQHINLSTTIKSNGQLELPPQNRANLSAVMGGRVKTINVLEGDYVKEGQMLAQLEHPDFISMQQSYLDALSRLAYLKKEFERQQELHKDSISSGKVSQEAESAYLSALATTNGLKAQLELIGLRPEAAAKGNFTSAIPVRSPINGYVKEIAINIGQFVLAEQMLFEIVDNDHIHIDLMVYEKDMEKVKKGQKVIFTLAGKTDEIYEGSIFAVGKSFENQPKAMMVHAEIDNKTGHLLPGMYVDARIVTDTKKAKALPNEAIVSDGGLNYIFVLKPGSSEEEHEHKQEKEYVFRKIEVNTGASDIGYTEAIPVYNLPEHIQIVSKGAFYLLAEMKKGEGGHGHHH